jgi:hypothetical protein
LLALVWASTNVARVELDELPPTIAPRKNRGVPIAAVDVANGNGVIAAFDLPET